MPLKKVRTKRTKNWGKIVFEQPKVPGSTKNANGSKVHWKTHLLGKLETYAIRQKFTDDLVEMVLARDWDKAYELAKEHKHLQFTRPKARVRTREFKRQVVREYAAAKIGKKRDVLKKYDIPEYLYRKWKKQDEEDTLLSTVKYSKEDAQIPFLDEGLPKPSAEIADPRPEEASEPSEPQISWSPWKEI